MRKKGNERSSEKEKKNEGERARWGIKNIPAGKSFWEIKKDTLLRLGRRGGLKKMRAAQREKKRLSRHKARAGNMMTRGQGLWKLWEIGKNQKRGETVSKKERKTGGTGSSELGE